MTRWKRSVVVALAVAFPLELVNFLVCMPPLDVGIADGASWYVKMLAFQWAVLHFPGLRLAALLDPYFKSFSADVFLWLLSGYVDTAVVILGVGLALQWLRRCMRGRDQMPI